MDDQLLQLVDDVRQGSKYRYISAEIISTIAKIELKKGRSHKDTLKAIRNKLHQVGTAYQPLGIPYQKIVARMHSLPHSLNHPDVRDFCLETMKLHTSTRERLPFLDTVFSTTLAGIAPLASVLDVACGLNPLALSWMPLADDVSVYVCDIFQDQIDFLNQFFQYFHINGTAFCCDLTQNLPQMEVQLAMALKTIPCLEQIDKQIGTRLVEGLNAKHILVSYPAHSLGGREKGMRENYARHFQHIISNHTWEIKSYAFPNEDYYLIQK